jgi:hypothetical protein
MWCSWQEATLSQGTQLTWHTRPAAAAEATAATASCHQSNCTSTIWLSCVQQVWMQQQHQHCILYCVTLHSCGAVNLLLSATAAGHNSRVTAAAAAANWQMYQ